MEIKLDRALTLTTERCESRYGIPVLVCKNEAYGPADYVPSYRQPAAFLVVGLAKKLTGEQRGAAANFLKQWPEGPQL